MSTVVAVPRSKQMTLIISDESLAMDTHAHTHTRHEENGTHPERLPMRPRTFLRNTDDVWGSGAQRIVN